MVSHYLRASSSVQVFFYYSLAILALIKLDVEVLELVDPTAKVPMSVS